MYFTDNCPTEPIKLFDFVPCEVEGCDGWVRSADSVPPGEKPDKNKHFFFMYWPGWHVFENLDDAVANAERRRELAIAKLQAQIDELNAVDFLSALKDV